MDSSLSLFFIEIAISLATSAIAVAALSSRLRRLLLDACGTEDRARFWVMYSGIMLFIAPLLTVIIFGLSSQLSTASLPFFKAAFGSALAGLFVALAAVGLQIVKVRPAVDPAERRATDGAAAPNRAGEGRAASATAHPAP